MAIENGEWIIRGMDWDDPSRIRSWEELIDWINEIGGFEITSEEVAQVEYYVRQIRKSAVLHSTATIDAYVVGAKLGDIDPEKETSSGRIHAVTYGQLVETATGKLFRLRQRLQEHYNALGQESIVEQALKETKQIKIDI